MRARNLYGMLQTQLTEATVCVPLINFISQCSLLALCGFQVTHDISDLNKNHLLGTFHVQLR